VFDRLANSKYNTSRNQRYTEQQDVETLPRTGLFLQMERNAPYYIQPFSYPNETIGTPASHAKIQELQKSESERLLSGAYGTGLRRLVYDAFEPSPAYPNWNTNEELWSNNPECFQVEPSTSSYNQVCCGKGAPYKFFTGKARYPETLLPFYKLQGLSDYTLLFESRFESGNLRRAVQVYFL
jgi:hypothetical protein